MAVISSLMAYFVLAEVLFTLSDIPSLLGLLAGLSSIGLHCSLLLLVEFMFRVSLVFISIPFLIVVHIYFFCL